MQLDDALAYFTDERKIMACLTVTGGDAGGEIYRARGGDLPVGGDSLFDLASLTKLFTGLTVMRLREEGALDLARPVTDYAPQFANLRDVPVDRVLGFETALRTAERVDDQPDRDGALRQLFAIRPDPSDGGRAYSDMQSMVLKYVIEGAAGESFFAALSRRILIPLSMRDTFAQVPPARLHDCVSCDREHRIEGGRWLLRAGVLPGQPHDPKARLLSPDGSDLCGHAGLFATRADLARLCRGILRGDVVSRESLRFMARNRTGRRLPGGGYSQYLGCQCYVKHPVQFNSEVPAYMSDETIALSGFTGHHLSVDPVTGTYALFLGDRVYDRLSVLLPDRGKAITDYGLAPDGSGQVTWTDGSRVFSSVNYVHQKDAHLHEPLARLLGLPVWRRTGDKGP